MEWIQEILEADPLKHLSPYQRYLAKGSKRIIHCRGEHLVVKEVLFCPRSIFGEGTFYSTKSKPVDPNEVHIATVVHIGTKTKKEAEDFEWRLVQKYKVRDEIFITGELAGPKGWNLWQILAIYST